MPLAHEKSKATTQSNLRSLGFWMSVEGQIPHRSVRVIVSYEALSQLDPSNIRDIHGALENFEKFRTKIEAAASKKYDAVGFDADKFEGMPAIRLTTDDLD
jgi:ribosomal protein L28